MKSKAICAALAILVAFPAGLGAQHAGFVAAGIAPGLGVDRTRPAHRVPGRGVVANRGTAFPHRGTAFPRHGVAVPRGSVVFAGPPAVTNAPRHEPRTPNHPVLAPSLTLIEPGTRHALNGRRSRAPYGVQRGIRVIQSGFGPSVAVSARDRHSGVSPVNIGRGTSRGDVIAQFGRPNVAILNQHSETMIFGATTIIIQNGVVAVIR